MGEASESVKDRGKESLDHLFRMAEGQGPCDPVAYGHFSRLVEALNAFPPLVDEWEDRLRVLLECFASKLAGDIVVGVRMITF